MGNSAPKIKPTKRTVNKLTRDSVVAFLGYSALQAVLERLGQSDVDPQIAAMVIPVMMFVYRYFRAGAGLGPEDDYEIDYTDSNDPKYNS